MAPEEIDRLVCGCQVQIDTGENRWQDIPAIRLPLNVRGEIEAEIDRGNETCHEFTASNGKRYRWYV